MKRKSILLTTALIALAILAGCSESVVYPTIPSAVSIRQTGDFVAGQDFDASKFEVKVTYLSGASEVLENAALELWGSAADGVTAGDQVYVNVGKNIDGYDVEYTANISRIYSVTSAKATTEEASFAIDAITGTATNVDPGLFTVTVYGSNGEPIVLGPSNYTVRIEADTAAAGYAAAETVEADAVIEFSGNIKTANTGLANIRIPVAATKTATIPSDDIIGISFKISSCAFKFAAFDYEGNLPEIDPAQLSFTLTYSDGETSAAPVKGSDIEGLELRYVDVTTGDPITEKINSSDFVSMAAGGNSNIAIAATANGVTTASNYTVPVEKTAVVLEYLGGEGEGIVENTPVDEVVLDPSDFRAYVTLNDKYAETITLTADMLSVAVPATGNVGAVGSNVAVVATYMGLPGGTNVPVIEAPAITIQSIDVTLVDGFEGPAKQYYNSGEGAADKLPTFDASTAIEKIAVTMSDGTVQEFTGTQAASVITAEYYLDEDTPLSAAVATEDGEYDVLADIDSIYVRVVYGTAVELVPVTLTEAVATHVELIDDYGDVAYYEAPITWTIRLYNDEGTVVPDYTGEYISYAVATSTSTKAALPTELTVAGSYKVAVVINGVPVESEAVELKAGSEWYSLDSDFSVVYSGDEIYIDKALSSVTKDDFTVSGYTYHGTKTEEAAALKASDVKIVTGETIAESNTVYVTVTYTDQNLNATASRTVPVTIEGTPWGEATAAQLAWADDKTVVSEIPAGTYNLNEFIVNGYTAHGDAPVVIKASFPATGAEVTSGSITLTQYQAVTFSYSYLKQDGTMSDFAALQAVTVGAPAEN